MANPLHIFRKYQYAFLVGFGIMLMFAFVVAPPLSDYLQTRAGSRLAANAVVVTWKVGRAAGRRYWRVCGPSIC